jgi:long-chain acyl-CoA synthetase
VDCPVLAYEEVAELGRAELTADEPAFSAPCSSDVATLVYTSNTSGISPREGVCLTHGNLMHQLGTLGCIIGDSRPGDTAVSMLPPWHVYERTTTYFRCVCAMCTVYSSPRHLRVDLLHHQPQYFCTVPLVLDAIASQANKRLALATGLTGRLARLLFVVGQYYVVQRRIAQGVNVDYARTPPPMRVTMWAALMTWLLRPLYQLADRLVYSRIRVGAGVHKVKCVVTGGGSFGRPLDDWFECVVSGELRELAPLPTLSLSATLGLTQPSKTKSLNLGLAVRRGWRCSTGGG